ncbi:hypothetical protein [Desulfocicer niacini]
MPVYQIQKWPVTAPDDFEALFFLNGGESDVEVEEGVKVYLRLRIIYDYTDAVLISSTTQLHVHLILVCKKKYQLCYRYRFNLD